MKKWKILYVLNGSDLQASPQTEQRQEASAQEPVQAAKPDGPAEIDVIIGNFARVCKCGLF